MKIQHVATKTPDKTIPTKGRKNEPSTRDIKVKVASIAGSSIGIATTLAILLATIKKRNISEAKKAGLDIASIARPKITDVSYGAKEVILMAGSSIAGGLLGGVLSDKKSNRKAKIREGLQQLGGNIIVPVSLLAAVTTMIKRKEFKLPDFKETSRFAKKLNPIINSSIVKALPKTAITIGTLIAGTKLGNLIMNKVNNKIFHDHKKRCLEAKDFSAHIDDLFYSSSYISENVKVQNFVSRALPFIFLIPGYETGTKQK